MSNAKYKLYHLANHINGRYLVLGNIRKTGILGTDQKLRLQSLKKWIEKEEGGKAKEIITNGINGMIVMFMAYALVYVILFSLNAATTGAPSSL